MLEFFVQIITVDAISCTGDGCEGDEEVGWGFEGEEIPQSIIKSTHFLILRYFFFS